MRVNQMKNTMGVIEKNKEKISIDREFGEILY